MLRADRNQPSWIAPRLPAGLKMPISSPRTDDHWQTKGNEIRQIRQGLLHRLADLQHVSLPVSPELEHESVPCDLRSSSNTVFMVLASCSCATADSHWRQSFSCDIHADA